MKKIDSTLQFLKDYVETIENDSSMRDFDDRFGQLEKHVYAKASKLLPPLNLVSKNLYDISHNTFYLIELFKYKFHLLAKAIIYSIETDNPLSLANNLRSLIEQFLVYTYSMNSIEKFLDNIKGMNDEKIICELINKALATNKRTYFGQKNSLMQDKSDAAIHINDALKEVGKTITNIKEIYDDLCEYVHPNYHGNLLISTGTLGKGKIEVKNNNHKDVKKLVAISFSIISILKKNTFYYPILTWRLHELVERCFQDNAKITNIFSEKEAKPQGDGKSIETAFYFPQARTSQEGLKLMYTYLESLNYNFEQINRKQVPDKNMISAGFHIDLWETPTGNIYFKTITYHGL